MSTIKGFTTLEQSRKLAEILPLESADFVWLIGHLHTDGPRYEVIRAKNEVSEPENYWPCWSLAALFELLPKRIKIAENVYELSVYFYGLYYWNVNNGNLFFESKDKDNFVDACYKLILKLNELNLL